MEFMGSLPKIRKGHDYMFMVIARFNKMCVLLPYKNTINMKEVTNIFFVKHWVHLGIPRNIISKRKIRFISALYTKEWEKMGTMLKRSTTLHLYI